MKKCIICNLSHLGKGKTCNRKCRNKLISLSSKGKTGGYRPGSGRAKSGYYKGIYCGSTYELVWVIYQIDHKIKFDRFPGMVQFNDKKYFPDFLQNNKIIEIKGFENIENVAIKTKIANNCGYEVLILRKENLKKEFQWVKDNYQYKNIFELYDNHIPKYTYECEFCKGEFLSEKPRKTKKKYCSRKCSGNDIRNNTQNGTKRVWINKNNTKKRINIEKIPLYIKDGWFKGK